MRPLKALRHFKTRAAMITITGVSRQACSMWFKRNLIPLKPAMLLAEASEGKLTVDPTLYA